MRRWVVLVAVALLGGSGCTHAALERRTVAQASTLSDVQFHQVLDNLAMFACNPAALAWHLKLTGGSVQVTDQGTGAFLDSVVYTKPPATYTFSSTLTAQRGVVNQWTGVPTIDPDNLEMLQLAYQKALNPQDPDGRLRQALYRKVCELSVTHNLVLTRDVLDRVIDNNPRLGEVRKWELKRKNAALHEELDKAFNYVARLSRPITEAQVDNYAQRLAGKITEDTRGEARARLQIQQEQQRVAVQQTRVGVEDEVVRLARDVCELPYIPRYPVTGRAEHNPRDVELAQNQIKAMLDLAERPEFALPWVCVAPQKRDVPRCACFVGHYCRCGCTCYAWVPPEHAALLRDFTLLVLTLAPLEVQESVPNFPTGAITYSPTISGGVR